MENNIAWQSIIADKQLWAPDMYNIVYNLSFSSKVDILWNAECIRGYARSGVIKWV